MRIVGSRTLLLAALAAAACRQASGEVSSLPSASVDSSLGREALAMRLALEAPSASIGLGLEAKEDERGLACALRLGSPDGPGPGLLAGPGSVSGSARILVDPSSTAPIALASPVALDGSLRSRSSVLALSAGPASLFAAAEGEGLARQLRTAALGLSYGISGSGGGLSAVAAASYGGPAPEPSGWRPDPSSSPALNVADERHPVAGFGLLVERRGPSGSSLAALAASYGRLAGPGVALRLEARERLGPLGLRCAAGLAGASYRGLYGARQESLLQAAVEARLAMRRASSLTASFGARAEGEGLAYAPSWGRRGGLRLIAPILGANRVFDTMLEAESPAEGPRGGSWSWALTRKDAARSNEEGAGYASSMRLGAALRWEASFSGAKLSISTRLAGEGGLPELGLDLALDLFDEGRAGSPVRAAGGLSLELPLRRGSSARLEASLPEAGLVLAPSAGSALASALAFSLRYRVSAPLGPRVSALPKAGPPAIVEAGGRHDL